LDFYEKYLTSRPGYVAAGYDIGALHEVVELISWQISILLPFPGIYMASDATAVTISARTLVSEIAIPDLWLDERPCEHLEVGLPEVKRRFGL
jgi:hypothetical protein